MIKDTLFIQKVIATEDVPFIKISPIEKYDIIKMKNILKRVIFIKKSLTIGGKYINVVVKLQRPVALS